MEKAKTGEHHNSFIPVQVVKHMSDLYSYDTQTTLGSGQYGSVYKVYRLKYITHKALYKKSGSHCVIKIVKRDRGYLRELDHLITLRGCYSVLPINRAVFSTEKLAMEFAQGIYNKKNAKTYI